MKKEEIDIIEHLLKAKGKSKADLARCWGREPSAASAFFKGERELTLDDLDKTAELLGINTVELVSALRGNGPAIMTDNEVFQLAMDRANRAVKNRRVKLKNSVFAEYVHQLFRHALLEKYMEGKAVLSQTTADMHLKPLTADPRNFPDKEDDFDLEPLEKSE